jgi:hypothetical protein
VCSTNHTWFFTSSAGRYQSPLLLPAYPSMRTVCKTGIVALALSYSFLIHFALLLIIQPTCQPII